MTELRPDRRTQRGIDDIRLEPAHLLIGCGVVAAAALSGIWAPVNLVLIVSLFVLLRVCWLEDNITNDLIGRDSLPGGYCQHRDQARQFRAPVAWPRTGRGCVQDAAPFISPP